jgi:hypothetical protein
VRSLNAQYLFGVLNTLRLCLLSVDYSAVLNDTGAFAPYRMTAPEGTITFFNTGSRSRVPPRTTTLPFVVHYLLSWMQRLTTPTAFDYYALWCKHLDPLITHSLLPNGSKSVRHTAPTRLTWLIQVLREPAGVCRSNPIHCIAAIYTPQAAVY